jgi:hypothetical protein
VASQYSPPEAAASRPPVKLARKNRRCDRRSLNLVSFRRASLPLPPPIRAAMKSRRFVVAPREEAHTKSGLRNAALRARLAVDVTYGPHPVGD